MNEPVEPVTWRFPKTLKLNNAAEFKTVLKAGKKRPGQYFGIFTHPNSLEYPRLGLIVGKKALRRATARNQVKRVLRESLRLNQHSLNLKGLDIAIIVYSDVSKLTKSELRQCIDYRLKQLSL